MPQAFCGPRELLTTALRNGQFELFMKRKQPSKHTGNNWLPNLEAVARARHRRELHSLAGRRAAGQQLPCGALVISRIGRRIDSRAYPSSAR